jgi:hypothetical protein
MKKLCFLAVAVLMMSGASADARDLSRFSKVSGEPVNVHQPNANSDSRFTYFNVDTAVLTLSVARRNLVLWSDSDFALRIGGELPSATGIGTTTHKAANGYWIDVGEFEVGTVIVIDVLPIGANAAGEVAPVYGKLSVR